MKKIEQNNSANIVNNNETCDPIPNGSGKAWAIVSKCAHFITPCHMRSTPNSNRSENRNTERPLLDKLEGKRNL